MRRFRLRHIVMAVTFVIDALVFVIAPNLDVAANVFLALLAAKSWVFVAVYGLWSDWRVTAAGQAVMRLVACLAVISTHGIATVLTDATYPGRSIIRPLLLAGVALALMDLLVTYVSIQRGASQVARGSNDGEVDS